MHPHPVDDLSPRVVLSPLEIAAGTVQVAREDLLPGGTKQRAAHGFLRDAISDGARSFVYASPAPGFAQVALAYTCQRLAVDCVLFCAQLDGDYHEFSLLAQSYGATIHPCATLDIAEKESQAYRDRTAGARKVPLGFADPGYLRHLRDCLIREWTHLTQDLGFEPRRVWLPVGSATLGTTFSEVLPDHVRLLGVDVRILQSNDDRLRALANRPRVTVYRTGEHFHQRCLDEPSIPSNSYYDAKLWSLIKQYGADGDLWVERRQIVRSDTVVVRRRSMAPHHSRSRACQQSGNTSHESSTPRWRSPGGFLHWQGNRPVPAARRPAVGEPTIPCDATRSDCE